MFVIHMFYDILLICLEAFRTTVTTLGSSKVKKRKAPTIPGNARMMYVNDRLASKPHKLGWTPGEITAYSIYIIAYSLHLSGIGYRGIGLDRS